MSAKQSHGWNGEEWKVEHEDGRTSVVFEVENSELQYLVCDFYGPPADRLRHARLAAAAPALLSLARQFASECTECNGEGSFDGEVGFVEACEACADIRAAIARATGSAK